MNNSTLKKYFQVTLGCQMNEHDSEVIAAMLESKGYNPVSSAEDADLIIINTCAVRKKPEDKVASLLGKYAALKEINKNLIIAVGGCMTQQSDAAHYIKDRFHFVDLVFGTHALPRLPELIDQASESKSAILDISEDYLDRDKLPVSHGSSFKAWLPIIYGCNNYCSYCVVPFVRGSERSRPFHDIINDAKQLAENGYLEITLLGQNVNSYGNDLNNGVGFTDLLKEINSIEGLRRIRFMTSHPKDLSVKLIETIAMGELLCEHFHLPVQSGSNRILGLMNRKYTKEKYLNLIKEIKDMIPGASITSDIIIGFPGENESDFQETLNLVQEARFDNAFSFIYSPRNNTAAAKMKETLSHAEKEDRLLRFNEVQHKISKEINLSLVGSTAELLVEGPSKNNPEQQTGRTRTNKLVHFSHSEDLTANFAEVIITEARTWNLVGELE